MQSSCLMQWSLVCFMLEKSKDNVNAIRWLYKNPAASHRLFQKLTNVIIRFMVAQVEAGAQASFHTCTIASPGIWYSLHCTPSDAATSRQSNGCAESTALREVCAAILQANPRWSATGSRKQGSICTHSKIIYVIRGRSLIKSFDTCRASWWVWVSLLTQTFRG